MSESAAVGQWVDPYPAYNFKVIVGGETVAHFTECSGINVDVATAEYREGGVAAVVHKVPTITTFHDVTLRYGLTSSTTLWDWFLTTVEGRVERRHVTIVLLDAAGSRPVLQFDLRDCYPRAWTGGVLRATAREVAIEEIVLAYESLGRSV